MPRLSPVPVERRAGGSVVLWESASLGVMLTPVDGRLIVSLPDGPHPFDTVAVTLSGDQVDELIAVASRARAAAAS